MQQLGPEVHYKFRQPQSDHADHGENQECRHALTAAAVVLSAEYERQRKHVVHDQAYDESRRGGDEQLPRSSSGEYQLLKQEQRAVIRQECDTAYNGVSEEFPEQAQQLPAFLFCQ